MKEGAGVSQIGHTAAVLPEVRDFLLGEEESPFLRLEFDSSERRKKICVPLAFFPNRPWPDVADRGPEEYSRNRFVECEIIGIQRRR